MAEHLSVHGVKTNIKRIFKSKGLHLETEAYPSNEEVDSYIYRIKDLKGNEYGSLSISNTIDYTIYENGEEKEEPTLHIRDIDVPESMRGKGIARAILLYGLCDSIDKFPHIQYSDLEDDTPTSFPENNPKNIYFQFGYLFKTKDERQEKQLNVDLFKERKMMEVYDKFKESFLLFERVGSPRGRSKTKKSRSRSRE